MEHSSPLRRQRAELKVCQFCGSLMAARDRVHRSRKCPGYSYIWAADNWKKLEENLASYAADIPGHAQYRETIMVTVTAPGTGWKGGWLDWDESLCAVKVPHRHDGTLGCKADSFGSSVWNAGAARRWRRLLDQVQRRVRKETGEPAWVLVRAWELQKRGLLHLHLVLAYSTPGERRSAEKFCRLLDAKRTPRRVPAAWTMPGEDREWFGFVQRSAPRSPEGAARYLASYFAQKRAGKFTLNDTVRADWLKRSPIHVSARLTKRTRVTMRTLRLRRFAHHLWLKRWASTFPTHGITSLDVWRFLLDGHLRPWQIDEILAE